MKQFLIAGGYGTSDFYVTLEKVNNDHHNLVYKRPNEKGGNILFPIYGKEVTCVVSAPYEAATTFTAKFIVPEVTAFLDYTVTFIKKGKQFNERNKWSFSDHAKSSDDAAAIATRIAKYVNDNAFTLGLTAVANGAAVTVTAKKAGEDYAVTFGDEMFGTTLTNVTAGKAAWMDMAMIKDIFKKCAADAGFEYTYDEFEDFYPGFDFDSFFAASMPSDVGFVVYSIRFTEPRVMATRDDAVYQMIHIAFIAENSQFETALTNLGAKIIKAAEDDAENGDGE